MQAPTLQTPRLILRPLSLDEWEDYAAAWADPEMTRFIGGEPRDRTTSWGKFIAAAGLWPICGFGYWSFIERETGRFVGNGGLSRFERGIPELNGYPEAGWAFIPSAWGKGYATEAIGAALDWADKTLGAPEIRCIINPDNLASINVATKLGFAQFARSDDVIGPTLIFRRLARTPLKT
jgi:RimJ/RimL family protein N-acetyltransferase